MDNTEGKKRKKAIALKYDQEKSIAPRVIAKGQGFLAEKIITEAANNKVHIREDEQLADYLSGLDLFQEIPPELYSVVAEILAFVYRADRELMGDGD